MLRFIDGFDHYAFTDLLGKWSTRQNPAATSGMSTSPVRTGAQALKLSANDFQNGEFITVGMGASSSTVLCGFGFYASSFLGTHFCSFGDGGVAHNQMQVTLLVTAAGILQVYRGASGGASMGGGASGTNVLLGQSGQALSAGQWYYLEFKATIHDTTGSVEVRVNGSLWISVPNVDTKQTANATANVFSIAGRGESASAFFYYDDLYLADGVVGDGVTDFLGPQKVVTVVAQAGNGTHTGWTPSTGTDHGELVNDATPNGDTDYVMSSTVGARESYNFPALGVIGLVNGVQTVNWLRNTEAGARMINAFVRSGITDYDHATNIGIDTTYRGVRHLWTKSAASPGNAWTVAEIDAAEFGVRVQA
jgi:hypothetical protein